MSRSQTLFSSGSFVFSFLFLCLRASDVQLLGEAKLVRDHCQGNCFAQVARKTAVSSSEQWSSTSFSWKADQKLGVSWSDNDKDLLVSALTHKPAGSSEGWEDIFFIWNPELRCMQSMMCGFGWGKKIERKGKGTQRMHEGKPGES